jgi:spore maturation protein CgeB
MKILVVGDGHSVIHEVAVVEAFKKLGHQVEAFYWQTYFNSKNPLVCLWQRVQNKFIIGPTLDRLNAELINAAVQFNPKLIFIYRGTHITPQTITEIKQRLPDCVVYGYNNDDPFADGHSPWLWRHFLKSVPKYDLVLAYRKHNIDEYLAIGAQRVELLRSWFISERNFPVKLTEIEKEQYECDVVFIGHYEDDGRLAFLEEIVRQGYHLRVFGPEWDKVKLSPAGLGSMLPIKALRGAQYNSALNASKIALCFLSKHNRDTYTRRCFEIPAAKTMLLAEYSEDLASLYNEGIDVDFFRNSGELIEKIGMYLSDDTLRNNVASSGYRRVQIDKHDVVSRMRQVIEWTLNMQKQKQRSAKDYD